MAATTPRNTADTELAPEGFLHRAPGDLPSVKMQYYSEDGTPSGEWLLRPLGTLVSTHWDLFTRGWVVQEHILSRRKIIFSPNELYWEGRYFKWDWLDTIERFSNTNLSYESDRLPALSGLASHFAQRHGQTYHAGISSGGIVEGLIWAPRQNITLVRPNEYIAPSWSWTCGVGSTQMKGPVKPEHESLGISPVLKDVAFNLIPHGQDPYGRLKGGDVQLTGWLKNAKMSREKDDDELYMLLHADERWMATFALDFAELAPAVREIQDVEILYVLSGDPALLVLQATGDGTQYTRVGLATVDLKWFESKSGEEKRITII